MAYCNECGAYIPDGQTKCLACGYDEAEEKQKAAAAATASATAGASATNIGTRYGFDNEELRRKLEEQRKKQQQQSQAWAEQERERRERQRQREERARAESTARSTNSYSGNRYSSTRMSGNRTESKVFAVLSYVSVLSLIPLLFRRDDEYALYHGRQGLALLIYSVVADILGAIPGIGWLFSAFRVVCVFKGMINAANDIKEPLPYIGKFAERFK